MYCRVEGPASIDRDEENERGMLGSGRMMEEVGEIGPSEAEEEVGGIECEGDRG